jgi:hypothetical protein
VIRRLTLALVVAGCYVAASGCGGGGEACLTCHFVEDGGTAFDAPITGVAGSTGGGAGGMAGTGPVGTAGRGGSGAAGTGVAGTGAAGTGVAGTGVAGMAMAGRGGSGPAGMGGSGPAGMGGSGPAGRGGSGPAGMGGSGPAGRGGSGPAGMGGSGPAGTGGGAAGRGGAAGTTDPSIVVWYKLDDTAGSTMAADSSGNARNGTVTAAGSGMVAFSTTHQVGTGALNITSSNNVNGGFVSLPASLNAMGATTAITIASWVNITTDRAWARVWDFNNSSTTGYMFLTAYGMAAMPHSVRFAITMAGNAGEQMISGPMRLSTGAWHHIAVVLGTGSTYTGTLYVDGVSVGTNTAMTLRPSNLGNTANNWIGRSAFTQDPYFHGLVDDFRVYNRELTAAEITALYAVR